MKSLLYCRDHSITNDIVIHNPTIREIVFDYGEDDYYYLISFFLATSYDLMLELEESGIDYSKVSDFDLFLMRFEEFQQLNTDILFPGIDFSKFSFAEDHANEDKIVIWDGGDIVIDDVIYFRISQFLRQVTSTKRNYEKMGNEEAKRYMLDRLRRKRARRIRKQKNKQTELSTLEQYIVSLVNTSEFPYDYESVLNLTLLQFNSSLQQVQRKVHCDYMMTGVFMGTIDPKTNVSKLSWIMNDV